MPGRDVRLNNNTEVLHTMRINTNTAALNASRNLSVTQSSLSKSLEKLSSGYRINRAADDAAGLAISEGMRAEIKGNSQALRNAQDGVSLIQTAEGALSEVHSMLQRMRELAVQASNGTSDGANETLEFTELASEIDAIETRTTFSGKAVFTDFATLTLQLSSSSGGSTAFAIDAFADEFTTDLAALDITDAASLDTLDTAITSVSTARATLGATQNRLEHTVTNLGTAIENLSASESRIRDVDMAAEMVSFTRNNILSQAGVSMLSQANQLPQSILGLLR